LNPTVQINASQYTAESGTDLYSDERIRVTPSWLSFDQSRYAIRTIARIDYETHRPKVGIAYVFFFASIILLAYSLYHFTVPELPLLVPWLMLLGSLLICVVSGLIAFSAKTSYRVMVTLIDGGKVPIVTGSAKQAQGLLDSLTRAMDWHRSDDVVIETHRASHVRKHHATAATDMAGNPSQGNTAASPVQAATESAVASGVSKEPHPSRVVRRLPPFLAGILKGRD